VSLEVQREFWLCECCTLAAVNGDPCQCDEHDKDVTRGLDRLSEFGCLSPNWDPETGVGIEEFSESGCDCCEENADKGGSLHLFVTLG
jgi:hypothetical protein